MTVLNYRDIAFARHSGGSESHYDILAFEFLDYHQEVREVTITWTSVGRKSVWLAQFTGLTTEYDGSMGEVLEKVYQHYQSNRYMPEEKK